MKKTIVSVNSETGEVLPGSADPVIKSQIRRSTHLKDYEINNMPSKTVPGMSMTIAEIVARHRKGLPIDQSKGALYQGDELVPDISEMDLVDRQNYMDSVADALVEVKARLAQSAKTKKEKEFLDQVDVAVREHLEKLKSKTITDLEELK